MRLPLSLFKRFCHDEGGAFLALFAVMAVALVATSGAVIDFVRIDSARTKAQVALDAATLALQPSIYTKTSAQIQQEANQLVNERIGDSSITAVIDAIDIDTDGGTLFLRAALKVPMAFVGLVGINELDTNIISQATRQALSLEVAFALDNSGSMVNSNRLVNLKSAMTCAINILFYQTCNPAAGAAKRPKVKVAIVPFTSMVNVGASNIAQPWIDQAGASSISRHNFDDDDDESTPFTGNVNRLALYAGMVNEPWKGCVEARPYPLSVNDTPPNLAVPDTLFVPSFAPDERNSTSGFVNSYIGDDPAACFKNGASVLSDLSTRERQERLCKYAGATPTYASNWGIPLGPNGDCRMTPITPLTDNPDTVHSATNAMVADGGTNIHMGTVWGWRTLSPTEPFSQGSAYDSGTQKILIVMTDGENTYLTRNNINGSYYMTAYGHLWNGRMGTFGSETSATLAAKMDALTLETCTNAKSAGITIYTIGLEPPNQNTISMLTSCASTPGNAYFPAAASELNAVFTAIAQQLSQLRIAR